MAPTYTRRTRAAKLEPFTLQNAWGSEQNAATIDIQDAAWGVSEVTVNADVALTVANALPEQARSIALILTGAGGFVVTAPAVDKPYLVVNNCANAVTVKPAGGTGATIRAGVASWYYTNAAGSIGYVVDPTLDKIKAPTAAVDMGGQRLTNQADGVANTDGATVGQIAPYATAAAASASSASTSAGTATTAANTALAAYDAFDDRYLGSKSSDPTLDNDGNALLTGAFYWNTPAKQLRVYDGGWLPINTISALAVTLSPQSPTAAQQGQARANIGAGLLSAFRNKLLNGSAGLSQRAASYTIAAGGSAYTADRWIVYNNTDQTVVVTPVARSPTSDPLPLSLGGYIDFHFTTPPTTGEIQAEQRIEYVTTLVGLASLRCYTYGPATTATSSYVIQDFGVSGSPAVGFGVPFNNPTFVQAQHDALITLPSISGKVLGSANDHIRVGINFTPRSAGHYGLRRMSFVEGDATAEPDPFSPRHIQQELALCQRYYAKTFPLDVAPADNAGVNGAITAGSAGNSNPTTVGRWDFPQTMRAAPSVTLYNPGAGLAGMWFRIPDGASLASAIYGAANTRSVIITSDAVSSNFAIHATAESEL